MARAAGGRGGGRTLSLRGVSTGVAALLVACALAGCGSGSTPDPPIHVYLGWSGDPARSMTVHWHSEGPAAADRVHFRLAEAPDSTPFDSATGERRPVSFLERRVVHVAQLRGLEPDSEYVFRLGGPEAGGGPLHRFRTAPAGEGAFTFVTGGDVGECSERVRAGHNAASAQDPLFAAIGGDLAYANGRPEKLQRWDSFLACWQQHMTRPDGRLVPMLVVPGNHDVREAPLGEYGVSPFIAAFFEQGSAQSYRMWRFGTLLELFALDTGHVAPIEGAQSDWLAGTLATPSSTRHRAAFYHVTAYSGMGQDDTAVSAGIRRAWVPLFERYGLSFAFENHMHLYKRSHRLRGGRPHPEGVRYVGDGSWGVVPRPAASPDALDYLERSLSLNAILRIDVTPDALQVAAIDRYGQIVDALPGHPAAGSEAAERLHSLHAALEGAFFEPAAPQEPARFHLRIHNPYPAPFRGRLIPHVPEGWEWDEKAEPFEVAPGGRAELALDFRGRGAPRKRHHSVELVGEVGDVRVHRIYDLAWYTRAP